MVAIVTLALVSSFQVDARLTADARVQTLIDVCTQRPTRGDDVSEKRSNAVQPNV